MELENRRSVRLALQWLCALFIALVTIWPILAALSLPAGELNEQIAAVIQKQWLYTLNFIVASMIAPVTIGILTALAFFSKTQKQAGLGSVVGIVFGGVYLMCATLAYVSQVTLLPLLLSHGFDVETIQFWYFNNPMSFPFIVDLLGYAFFSVSVILITYKFFFEKGSVRWIAILMTVSAVLSIAAFIGVVVQVQWLQNLTIASGIVTLPAMLLVLVNAKKISGDK